MDTLPPTQYLVMQVLAARHRTGEMLWTFPARLRPALDSLTARGLVATKGGVTEGTVRAWLTDAGMDAAAPAGYSAPVTQMAAERDAMVDRLAQVEALLSEHDGHTLCSYWTAEVRRALAVPAS